MAGEKRIIFSSVSCHAVFYFFHLQKILQSNRRRFSFFSRPKGRMKNFKCPQDILVKNNLAPFRAGEKQIILSNVSCHVVFYFFPLQKVLHST
jgi:hypothetical protein